MLRKRPLHRYTFRPKKARLEAILYHGTKQKYLPAIMEEGLKPMSEDELGRKSVFLTKSPRTAEAHAAVGPEREQELKLAELIKSSTWSKLPDTERAEKIGKTFDKSPSVVLEIDIPDTELTESSIDPVYESLYLGTISPDKIKIYKQD